MLRDWTYHHVFALVIGNNLAWQLYFRWGKIRRLQSKSATRSKPRLFERTTQVEWILVVSASDLCSHVRYRG